MWMKTILQNALIKWENVWKTKKRCFEKGIRNILQNNKDRYRICLCKKCKSFGWDKSEKSFGNWWYGANLVYGTLDLIENFLKENFLGNIFFSFYDDEDIKQKRSKRGKIKDNLKT